MDVSELLIGQSRPAARHRGRRALDAGERSRHDARAHGRAATVAAEPPPAEAAPAAPAEPEVIKKGKAEKEGEA